MIDSDRTEELVIMGCGEVYQTIVAEVALFDRQPATVSCIAIPSAAAIATQADGLLAKLEPMRHKLFIAVDSHALNHARLELYGRARLLGFRMATLVHPQAWVSADAALSDNVWIGFGAYIGPGCKLDSNTMVGAHARLGVGVTIGAHGWLGSGARVGSGTNISPHCVIGADMQLRAATEVGRYCLLEQGGPWRGRVVPGTFAAIGYNQPARVVGAGYTHSLRS